MMHSTRPLSLADCPALVALLAAQRPDYVAHFQPFAFDAATLEAQLRKAREDRYWALLDSGTLAGFFMLRGWDEGYARPAFGVFVGEEFAGRGLARRALEESIACARQRKAPGMMLTVSPENPRAKALYLAAGFSPAGVNVRTGQEMMELSLVPGAGECQNTVLT